MVKAGKKINKSHLYTVMSFIGIGIIYYFIVTRTPFSIECKLNKYFHINCFTCGLTRMVVSLVRLDFYHAFRYNIVLFVTLP
ncbi:MAG: DUF2752 domain-containing protein, partial [Lachnospiraceae bacterium]|nr:DUF2752 domain-containing protein [Lachnospiraceae bacterium]